MRRSRAQSAVLLALAVIILWPSLAAATSNRVPTGFARRELTLPKSTFRLDNGEYWPLPYGLVQTTFVEEPDGDGYDTFTEANLGFGLGIVRNWELGVHFLRLDFDPTRLDDPSAYFIFRFLDKDVEIGVFGGAKVPFKNEGVATGGLPIAFHLGDPVRLDTGPFLVIPFRDRPSTILPLGPLTTGRRPTLIVPFQLPINPSQQLYLGPEAAVVVYDVFEDDQSRTDFLLGFFVGYTMRSGGGTLGDIGGRFRMPSTDAGMDIFQVLFELKFYFDL